VSHVHCLLEQAQPHAVPGVGLRVEGAWFDIDYGITD